METAAAIFIFTSYFVQPGQNNGQIFKSLKQKNVPLLKKPKEVRKKLQRDKERIKALPLFFKNFFF